MFVYINLRGQMYYESDEDRFTLNLNRFCDVILDIMLGIKYSAICINAEKSIKQGCV